MVTFPLSQAIVGVISAIFGYSLHILTERKTNKNHRRQAVSTILAEFGMPIREYCSQGAAFITANNNGRILEHVSSLGIQKKENYLSLLRSIDFYSELPSGSKESLLLCMKKMNDYYESYSSIIQSFRVDPDEVTVLVNPHISILSSTKEKIVLALEKIKCNHVYPSDRHTLQALIQEVKNACI